MENSGCAQSKAMSLLTKVKNQWLGMRHSCETPDHTTDCAGFHRATTTSFHIEDLPWRFSGKLHIQGSQRARSRVSSDSRLPLPALPYPSWSFSPPCISQGPVLQAGPVFIAQSSWVQLKGIDLHAQASASQEQSRRSRAPLHTGTAMPSSSHSQLGWAAKPWSSQHLSHPLGNRDPGPTCAFRTKDKNVGGSHPTNSPILQLQRHPASPHMEERGRK